jgi:hypothetical protein
VNRYQVVKKIKEKHEEQKRSISKKLLVGSIFMSTDDLMCRWLDLQLRYLHATTDDFEHVAFVTDCSRNSYFSERTTLLSGPLGADMDSHSHVRGLNVLLHYFLKVQHRHKYFLFLDMDAFPIRQGWLELLEDKLKNYEIAAPIRSENLETRLHSSILLVKEEALPHLTFDVSSVGLDMIGKKEADVNIAAYQTDRRNLAYPLLRSNRYNIHPLLFGIYCDLFYHNSCGTGRRFNMRARDYWGHMTPPDADVMGPTEELFVNPNAFIGRLAGYNCELYAKV